MPPKKRKQSARAPSPAPEVPDTVTTPRGKTFDTTAAASRPKRSTAMPPPDQPTPKKAKTATGSSAKKETPKCPGRPSKTVTSSATPKSYRVGARQSARLSSTPAASTSLPPSRKSRSESSVKKSTNNPPAKRGRGRPPKHPLPAEEAAADNDMDDGFDDSTHDANITEATTIIQSADQGHDDDDDDRNFWLMKAEPDSRIERNANGEYVDVKFTIDDLRDCSEPEPWDGIRNPQAQNNMKAMKAGDLAFFYESNCKKPGIVGIMEIVREASLDHTAFSKDSLYYDPKSDPNNPRWILVHVEFRRKFADKLTLKELQKFSRPGGALAEMALFKQSRLSVSKVSKTEWDFILSLIDEDDEEVEASMGAERFDDSIAPAEDLGNDFATAFEAPDNLGVGEPVPTAVAQSPNEEPPVDGDRSEFVEQLSSFAEHDVDGPVSPALPTKLVTSTAHQPGLAVNQLDRSVSRGRSKRPVPVPAFRASAPAEQPKPESRGASKQSATKASRTSRTSETATTKQN